MDDATTIQFDLTPPTEDQLRNLEADLSEQERHVLLEHGTEAPFCGVFLDEKRPGVYTCRLCGLPLFKGGSKFEDVAKKNSKDPGSAEKGGDLDWANPGSYVPEFSQAMTKLQKGQMTETPVKSQFGWHIIRLDDTRAAQFPPLAEVKGQIQQRLGQMKLAKFRDDLRAKAKTDYKFSQ